MTQYTLFTDDSGASESSASLSYKKPIPFKTQLLKWVGNKQRFAHEIISFFPETFGTYFEPFLGSGGVLAVLAPKRAIASDSFKSLMEIWWALKDEQEILKDWYESRWRQFKSGDKVEEYENIKASFNANPNGADLLFLCRACYGGVVRFRQADGFMSTPCGSHEPVSAQNFAKRVDQWLWRVQGTEFCHMEYEETMDLARPGDVVYCDPPYSFTQAILYGAQNFSLETLFKKIEECKNRGVYVVLSIDGSKKSGNYICDLPIPEGLFRREIAVNCGRSMLRRFQMGGKTLESEVVTDRLLLTY